MSRDIQAQAMKMAHEHATGLIDRAQLERWARGGHRSVVPEIREAMRQVARLALALVDGENDECLT